jgi:hypothetical protein
MFDKKLLLQHIKNQDVNEQAKGGRMLGEPDPVPTPDNSFFPGASALKKKIFSTNFRKSFFQTVGEKRAAKMSGKNIGVHKSKPGEKPEVFAARYKKENDPFKPRFPFRTVTERKPSKGGGLITPFSRSGNMNEGAPEGAPIKDKNKIGASVAAAVKKLMKPGYEDPDTPTASPPARSSGGY